MSRLRLVAITASLMLTAACGSGSSSYPAAPSPTPSAPVPAPAPAPNPAPAATAAVAIPLKASVLGNRAFVPDELDVAAGTTVTWTNTDVEAHTSTSDASGWNSGVIAPGRDFSFAFSTAGTFTYHCAIHPGMIGTVVVR